MPIEKWSESIVVVRLADDPQFSEDLQAVEALGSPSTDVVLDFAALHFVNSSNLARLLRLRRQMQTNQATLLLCNVNNQIWGTLLGTGLEKLFQVTENVPTALATLQMQQPKKSAK